MLYHHIYLQTTLCLVFFFFYKFLIFYKQNSKILLIILLNIFLSIPAFTYLFYFNQFFFFQNVVSPLVSNEMNLNNFLNKISIIITIIFFYYLPFLNKTIFKKKNLKRNIFELFTLGVFVILVFLFFNYPSSISGGGIFFKISNYIFNNNYLFYIICFISFLFIQIITKNNLNNLILVFCLILSNPQFSIYHKYFDPLIIILFLTVFEIKFLKIKINQNLLKNLYLFYIIFISLSIYKLSIYNG